MARPESQNSKRERPVRRTGIIYMRKKDLFDALKEMFKKSRDLRLPKSGWGEFRDSQISPVFRRVH